MLLSRIVSALFNKTLNSVYFGICTMVLVGAYVAIGSGLPQVREFFEMNELQFFNAWPLKLLMWLLVLNLATVTFTRIPFTKPRYGVWMIHTGIILLIFSMGYYYKMKIEGLAIVMRGGTATSFYDSEERSLHIRIGGLPVKMQRLPSLPRFKPYAEELGNADRLNHSDLRHIVPVIEFTDAKGKPQTRSVSQELGLPGDLHLDVVGYYPWATVHSNIVPADRGPDGIKLTMNDPHSQQEDTFWLMAGDPRTAITMVGDVEFEHRRGDGETLSSVKQAAAELHRLDISVAGYQGTLFVEPGKNYELGKTGYSFSVEEFNPDFPAMNGEHVQLLTLMVKTPTQTFRRQLIPGRDKPTDWKLNVPGTGPMGKRQTTPLDEALKISYSYSDPLHLLSSQGADKKLVLTDDTGKLVVVSSSPRGATTVEELQGGVGVVNIGPQDQPFKVKIERMAHVNHEDSVAIVPPSQRDTRMGESGAFQVLMVKVSSGNWSKVVPVPYSQWAAEPGVTWEGGSVIIPGTEISLQMQLGQSRLPLPARVTLKNFELVTYPGGTPETTSIFRDFKSTLDIEPWRKGDGPHVTEVAHMNHPIYWGGIGNSYWTFFQAQWDPQGQRYTVLGVGNRPGVWLMVFSCALMITGLWWAFYLKPIIIARMKRQALAKAAKKKELISA